MTLPWDKSDKPLEWTPAPEVVAKCLKSPLKNVKANLAFVYDALEEFDIHYWRGALVCLATIGVEAREFRPIKEYGGDLYYFKMYDIKGNRPDKARELGNVYPGDGIKFCGRGFVQLTGRANYRACGEALDLDLENNPDLLIKEPEVSARALAWYARTHGLDVAAQKEDWNRCRKIVNGGYNHLKEFLENVERLKLAKMSFGFFPRA